MAFRVGDRVRCIDPSDVKLEFGRIYQVVANEGALVRMDNGLPYYPYRFKLVEPYKLEKGATVCIGDGQDEWTVEHVSISDRARIMRGEATLSVEARILRVVKPAPEKDFYCNAKGKSKTGDVYLADGTFTVVLEDGIQCVWPRTTGMNYTKPHLLVRDGKRWDE